MLNFFQKNAWFYFPYLLFLVAAGTILLFFGKADIHLYINQLNSKFADLFFKHTTNLGDGIVVGVLIFILFFIRYRYAIIMLLSTLSVTLLVQSFKRYIFPHLYRPKSYFEDIAELHFVPGVDVHDVDTFPSGHTASGFTIFLFLALVCKNNFLKLLFFVVAFCIGYSRMYLSQHFLVDIYFGSIIAVVFTTLFFIWVANWKNNKLDSSLLYTLKIKKA